MEINPELEQSNTAKSRVPSLHPGKCSVPKQQIRTEVSLPSCVCLCEAMKCTSNLRILDFPTTGEERFTI